MFHLVVLGSEEQWDHRWVSVLRSRFLEGTSDSVRAQFESLGTSEIAALTAMPALLMSEGSDDHTGRLGRITRIRVKDSEIGFTFEVNANVPPITWRAIMELAWDLDVSAGERTRTHWAIKDADLLEILGSNSVIPQSSQDVKPTRAQLLSAAKDLEQLGHSDFDRFLLELGIEGLDAGRDVGSLTARANALCRFALKNPTAETVEGSGLWREISRRAQELRAARPGYFPAEVQRGSMDEWKLDPEVVEQVEGPVLDAPTASPLKSASAPINASLPMNKVFLVHGRDDGLKETVARFLEKIGLEVTILHERPNKGRTLISKFRDESAGISYAIVLMTPDDEGGLKGQALSHRARQNVVFELGFFIGKLGADRVCALVQGSVEKPSDFDAVVYVGVDSAGAWKRDLARELSAAGLTFDHSKVFQ